jgi:hypothetical protein
LALGAGDIVGNQGSVVCEADQENVEREFGGYNVVASRVIGTEEIFEVGDEEDKEKRGERITLFDTIEKIDYTPTP